MKIYCTFRWKCCPTFYKIFALPSGAAAFVSVAC